MLNTKLKIELIPLDGNPPVSSFRPSKAINVRIPFGVYKSGQIYSEKGREHIGKA